MSEPSNRKYEWEAWMLEEVIPYYENRLIRVANNISKKVIELLEEYRRRENNGAINLGIVVRVRPDTLGPRITWVRFKGKSRNGRNGKKFTPTEPVKLAALCGVPRRHSRAARRDGEERCLCPVSYRTAGGTEPSLPNRRPVPLLREGR